MPACRAAPSPDAATGAEKYLAAPSRSPPRSRAGRNVAGGLSRRILQQMASRIRRRSDSCPPVAHEDFMEIGSLWTGFQLHWGKSDHSRVRRTPCTPIGAAGGAIPGSARGEVTRWGG